MTLRYSVDTSALIGAWTRRLPPDIVPTFWTQLDGLIAEGHLGCIDEVKLELEKKDDKLFGWIKERPELVIPMSEDIIVAATDVIRSFPILTKPGKNRDAADPFVVALAQTTGAIVVTEEQPATKPSNMKIPEVCRELGIECLDVYGFVRRLGWRF